jgi:hypothetical protein
MGKRAAPRADGGVRFEEATQGQRMVVQKARAVRRDGWTAAKRRAFLDALAATCNVRASVRAVSMSLSGAYQLAYRDAQFRAEWRAAIGLAYHRLEQEMLERALIGEARMQDAVDRADSAEAALDILSRHPLRVAETLYRNHRGQALDWAADGRDDGSAAVAAIEARIAAVRRAVMRRTGGAGAPAPADGKADAGLDAGVEDRADGPADRAAGEAGTDGAQ